MKRSEMIGQIAGLLSTHKYLEKDHPSAFIGFAAEILTLIEEAGMLPPSFIIEEVHRDLFSHLNDNYFSEYLGEEVNGWEPEDE